MTQYSIQVWNGEEQLPTSDNRYETFDDACDDIEELIKTYAIYNEPTKLNREWIEKKLEDDDKVLSYELLLGYRFYVLRKQKYVYQYYVDNSHRRIQKISAKYNTLDEAYDAMDKELAELYDDVGEELFQPPHARENVKKLIEKYPEVVYAYFNDGENGKRYILERKDAS